MAKVFFIAPASAGVGLTSVCLSLLRALDNVGLRVGFFKPFAQSADTDPSTPNAFDRSVEFARDLMGLEVPDPMHAHYGHNLMSQKEGSLLMEQVVTLFHTIPQDVDVIVVEGLVPSQGDDYSSSINVDVARNLDADVILVAAAANQSPEALEKSIELSYRLFADPKDPDIVGCILNKVIEEPADLDRPLTPNLEEPALAKSHYAAKIELFRKKNIHLIATIPWRQDMLSLRMSDVAQKLKADTLNIGDSVHRRVRCITVCARTLPNMVSQLVPGALVVTPGDREDILVACCMAALTGVPLAGIVLTSDLTPDERTLRLCRSAFETGLTVLKVETDTYATAQNLARLDTEVPLDDLERIELAINTISAQIDVDWLNQRIASKRPPRMSPAAFRYQLTKRARAAGKTIVLPEGNEPRTIQAASICHSRGIANCILIGKPAEIASVAAAQGVVLGEDIRIIDPDDVRAKYIDPMVALRKHKGLTPQMAEAQLEDTVVLATMMLALGEVDGLVSGAVHTTANTVRPAFQLIKARKECRIVSSVFFMCLPEQVVVYGDCAINPDPDAEELADIALQCADSATLFGIDPKVAMLSYSTGSSGFGSDVDKVKEATRIAKEMRPELLLDGPLQYDAAVMEDVARKKAPDSKVAGKATVFVFPDLNTGNTTYKAVQRSANVISVGPMLQGLKKPVNDLSRGALVEDIVFTIALTAVQATQNREVISAS